MDTAHVNPAFAGSFPEQFPPRLSGRSTGGGTPPTAGRRRARGSTALDDTHTRPRHVVGSVFRAVRVFADTAFRVIVLGPDSGKL